MAKSNKGIKFVKRPGVSGKPTAELFEQVDCEYPKLADDTNDHIIVKTLYLSVDPIQRNQMNEKTDLPMFPSYKVGAVISGVYGVGVVEESQNNVFQKGDIVINSELNGWPWQLYFNASTSTSTCGDGCVVVQKMQNADTDDPKFEITYYGMTGLTTLIALQEHGHMLGGKGANKSFVVSGAAGACGHVAGQIALLNGCKPVVGICGKEEKCRVLKDDLDFTGTINYKTDDVGKKLDELCPNGVDVYFDNVGGKIAETVIKRMNANGHVVLVGQISSYSSDEGYPNTLSKEVAAHVENKNITREAFVSVLHKDKFEAARKELKELKDNKDDKKRVKVLDTVVEGLENVGRAFCDMMEGKNVGKMLVKV